MHESNFVLTMIKLSTDGPKIFDDFRYFILLLFHCIYPDRLCTGVHTEILWAILSQSKIPWIVEIYPSPPPNFDFFLIWWEALPPTRKH